MSTHNICFYSNEYPQHMFLWRTDENYPSMKKRTISNAYQIPPAGQLRKLISRIQRPYKMAKLFNQKNFLA